MNVPLLIRFNKFHQDISKVMPKKILVVFGATGVQGGSVVKSILADPSTAEQFKIRGVTRDPSKPNAKALTAKGVECVVVSQTPLQSLPSAFHPASGKDVDSGSVLRQTC